MEDVRIAVIGSRPALMLLLAACLAAGASDLALAHGGNFRAPPGPGGGPSPGIPGLGNPGLPVPVTPSPRSIPTPSGPAPTPGGRLPKTAQWTPCGWGVWWQLNREAFLPIHGSKPFVAGVVTPSSPVYRVGRSAVGNDAPIGDERLEHGANELALPYLLELINPRNRVPEPLVSAALIAVGRIARKRPPTAVFRYWANNTKASLEVRESAVLALGLLRRTEKERQIPVEDLSRIREYLLALFDSDRNPTRIRAFAVLSLALLADQPYPDDAFEKDGKLLTRALWQRLQRKYPSQELTISLLTAIGYQSQRGVPSAIRDSLLSIARGKPVFRRGWDAMERSHALMAYARLGGPACTDSLLHTLRYTREHDAVQSAALLGVALRAETMTPGERVEAVRMMRKLLAKDRMWMVRGLGHLTMGSILGADMREGSNAVLEQTDLLRFLENEAKKGPSITRPFSTLALGIAAHRVRPQSRPIAKALETVRDTQRWGLKWGRGSDELVGAYAVAAGLSHAEDARPLLLEILEDTRRMPCLRGHAALALGQLLRPTPDIVEALLAATRERISAFIHLQSVRALGLLQSEGVTQELLKQLDGKKRSSRPALAAVAGALGRVRDPQAVSILLDIARDKRASLYLRVASVMGLGLTFDPEPRPSRTLLSTHSNYPSLTWSLVQVFNIM